MDAIQVEMQKDVRKDEVITFYKIRKDEDLFLTKSGKSRCYHFEKSEKHIILILVFTLRSMKSLPKSLEKPFLISSSTTTPSKLNYYSEKRIFPVDYEIQL